jgi:rubrerythrin
MSVFFNADEIFEMAEQIERNGARFYRKVAGSSDDPSRRELLLNLAAMEDDHEKTFKEMRAELKKQEKQEVTFDPEAQAALYLQAFADGQVFDVKVDPSEKLTGRESMEDILRIAIGLERDSIAFYTGIREMVPESLGKSRIEAIIREEMKHVSDLSQQHKSISKG